MDKKSQETTGGNTEARYVGTFGGWLAFHNGITLRTRQGQIKVFRTREEALAAAAKSTAFWPR